ncbi:MAG TPA: Smr/MutS family protein, partial [Gemmatimonadales bacterium]|nr:Smr/MutS family protein [Gemmatimonadales bacterium]
LKDLASHTPGIINASLQFDAVTLTPTYRFLKGVPGRSYGLSIARRLGVGSEILADAEARVPDAERSLDTLLAAVEERERELRAEQQSQAERAVDLESLAARLALQNESQAAREADLKRREKEAERQGRQQARAYLLEARQRVEEALSAARGAVDEAASREARRLVEDAIRVEGEALAGQRGSGAAGQFDSGVDEVAIGTRVRLESGGTGEVTEIRSDGRIVVAVGAIRVVTEASGLTIVSKGEGARVRADTAPPPRGPAAPLEIDLRGMTGDEAEMATIAAVDAAVLSEQPLLRIIHGMGTGVVRERVQRVVSKDRRVSGYAFAPRNQGGTGVTIVEFSA